MTNQEILEYNKRCLKFLYPNYLLIGENDFLNYNYDENLDINNLKVVTIENGYHIDWNKIHDIINKIEILGFWVKIYGFTSFEKIHHQCSIKKQKPKSNGEYIYEFEGDWNESKKEAVIKAINEFLNWYYEQQKNTGTGS